MIQYLYFISYPIFHPKEIKNKIKMFHIFQQTARVSLIKYTNIDKLVTILLEYIHTNAWIKSTTIAKTKI